jgi:hypothetical protein
MKAQRPLAFRWVLPIAELLLSALLLRPSSGFFFLQARSAAHARWPERVEEPKFEMPDSPISETPEVRRQMTLMEARIALPALLNLPSGFIGLGRRELVPRGMLPEFWRSITWPLSGLIFWWMIGRGVESLASARRNDLSPTLTWLEVTVAAFVVIIASVFCAGLVLDPDKREGIIYPWVWMAAACAMWILLGTSTIVAWAIQCRMRRRRRRELSSGGVCN